MKLLRSVLDLLVPRRCLVCDEPLGDAHARRLCDDCLESADRLSFEGLSCCPSCGLPAPARCGECAAHPPRFDEARSYGLYDGALRDALLRLKFAGRTALARPLGRLVAGAAGALPPADAVVAVPLHPARMRERGFNQAALLARTAAKALGLPRLSGALVRSTATAPQTRRSRRARAVNLAGAMRADARAVAGRRILLVDDVLTTGATANACAAALRNAGARAVYVATVARSLPPGASISGL